MQELAICPIDGRYFQEGRAGSERKLLKGKELKVINLESKQRKEKWRFCESQKQKQKDIGEMEGK